MPAKAGVQSLAKTLGPRFRGDEWKDNLSTFQFAAHVLGRGNRRAPQRFEMTRDAELRERSGARRNQQIREREAFAPQMIDHRMIRRGAGVDLYKAFVIQELLRQIERELHAG